MAKQKQKELPIKGPGISPVRIAEIDRLAEAYVKERDKRLLQTPKEIAAKARLIDALHAHADKLRSPDGILVYRYDESVITLESGKEKLRVQDDSRDDENDE
jgi:hypothetical protein